MSFDVKFSNRVMEPQEKSVNHGLNDLGVFNWASSNQLNGGHL